MYILLVLVSREPIGDILTVLSCLSTIINLGPIFSIFRQKVNHFRGSVSDRISQYLSSIKQVL